MVGRPQISKITPISDLLSYQGCLSVEQPRTLSGDTFSVVKYNTSVHTTCAMGGGTIS